jgi:hypothetical protein
VAASAASSSIPLKIVTFASSACAVRQPACVPVTPANPQNAPAHAMATIVRRFVAVLGMGIGYLRPMGRSANVTLPEKNVFEIADDVRRRSLAKRSVLCSYKSIRRYSQYEKSVMMTIKDEETNSGAR